MRAPIGTVAMPARMVVPMAAASLMLLIGSLVYSAQLADMHRQAAHRHRTDAVLQEASVVRVTPWKGRGEAADAMQTRAKITWMGAGGVRHVQEAAVPPNRPAGTHITIWVDSSGALTGPPSGRDAALLAAALAAATALSVMLIGLCAARVAGRVLIARRAAAGIDDEWRLVATAWTGRRG